MSFHLGLYQYYTANFSGLSENVYDFAKCRLAHYHRKKSESIKAILVRVRTLSNVVPGLGGRVLSH